jgi:hypothetical protein
MACNSGGNVCTGATVTCGSNSCTATCAGNYKPSVGCGPSCDCTAC